MLRNGLQPVAEEEDAAAWLLSPGATVGAEQEDAWDWVRGIASGVATGASTGAALGPYGALVGGLVGGGLGALQTAQQQQGTQGSSSAAGAARNPAVPTNPATIQTPSGIDGSNRPATAGVTASQPSGDVLSQLAALLPVLIQLLSSSSARAPRAESVPIESGDLVPDEAFLNGESADNNRGWATTSGTLAGSARAVVDRGIENGIPEVSGEGQEDQAVPQPEYPLASRFVPAAASNFRDWPYRSPRPISRIVIHITDGGRDINGTVAHFRDPATGVSAHYIVGQDGEVVQMVRNNQIAYHAHNANTDSIGIEHVANTRGLLPTAEEYASSAALVRWLCDRYRIPPDRAHIRGHSEADPQTTHIQCPNAVWDWDEYMALVQGAPRPQLSAPNEQFRAEPALTLPRAESFSADDESESTGPQEWLLDALGPAQGGGGTSRWRST